MKSKRCRDCARSPINKGGCLLKHPTSDCDFWVISELQRARRNMKTKNMPLMNCAVEPAPDNSKWEAYIVLPNRERLVGPSGRTREEAVDRLHTVVEDRLAELSTLKMEAGKTRGCSYSVPWDEAVMKMLRIALSNHIDPVRAMRYLTAMRGVVVQQAHLAYVQSQWAKFNELMATTNDMVLKVAYSMAIKQLIIQFQNAYDVHQKAVREANNWGISIGGMDQHVFAKLLDVK